MKWLRQFRAWNRTLGLGATIVVNISLLLLSYFVIYQITQIGFHFGWWKSQGHFGWDDLGVAVISGYLIALSSFSKREKAQATGERKHLTETNH
jgi:hypothetical protein